MSDHPVSLAFFDPERGVHGTVRTGLTLLFEGSEPAALPEAAAIAAEGDGWSARIDGRLELAFRPAAEAATLAGSRTVLCRVSGTVAGGPVDCLGTATDTTRPPAWGELDAVRGLSALFDEGHAVLAVARRLRGVAGHGDELVTAALVEDGQVAAVEDARISTVYDGDGRQRHAGLEMWLPGEDFPRRASGTVAAGTSLMFEGLRVQVAVFEWQMEGRSGAGAYELAVREPTPAAA